jgi:hypothetical protein
LAIGLGTSQIQVRYSRYSEIHEQEYALLAHSGPLLLSERSLLKVDLAFAPSLAIAPESKTGGGELMKIEKTSHVFLSGMVHKNA